MQSLVGMEENEIYLQTGVFCVDLIEEVLEKAQQHSKLSAADKARIYSRLRQLWLQHLTDLQSVPTPYTKKIKHEQREDIALKRQAQQALGGLALQVPLPPPKPLTEHGISGFPAAFMPNVPYYHERIQPTINPTMQSKTTGSDEAVSIYGKQPKSSAARLVGVVKERFEIKPNISNSTFFTTQQPNLDINMPLTSLVKRKLTRKRKLGSLSLPVEDVVYGCLVDVDPAYFTTAPVFTQGRVIQLYYKTSFSTLHTSANVNALKLRTIDRAGGSVETVVPWPHPHIHVHRFNAPLLPPETDVITKSMDNSLQVKDAFDELLHGFESSSSEEDDFFASLQPASDAAGNTAVGADGGNNGTAANSIESTLDPISSSYLDTSLEDDLEAQINAILHSNTSSSKLNVLSAQLPPPSAATIISPSTTRASEEGLMKSLITGEQMEAAMLDDIEHYYRADKKRVFKVVWPPGSTANSNSDASNHDGLHPEDDPEVPHPDPEVLIIGKLRKMSKPDSSLWRLSLQDVYIHEMVPPTTAEAIPINKRMKRDKILPVVRLVVDTNNIFPSSEDTLHGAAIADLPLS